MRKKEPTKHKIPQRILLQKYKIVLGGYENLKPALIGSALFCFSRQIICVLKEIENRKQL